MIRFIVLSLAICLPVAMGVCFLSGGVARVLFPNDYATCQRVIYVTIWSLPLLASCVGAWPGNMTLIMRASRP